MRYAVEILKTLGGCIIIAALHMGLSYIFPYPLNKINSIFAFLVLAMMWSDSGIIVWLSFLLHFFIELYALSPFGIILFSGTFATLFLFWLYRNILINRSFLAVVSLSLASVLLYRLLYTILLVIFNSFPHQSFGSLLIIYAWEALFTMLGALLVYSIMYRFTKRFNVRVLR